MTSASPNDSLKQATQQANYQAHHATSFGAVLIAIAVFSMGCCANCFRPIGAGAGGVPPSFSGGGYSGNYAGGAAGAYSSPAGQLGFGRSDSGLQAPSRVTPWDPYGVAPSQAPSLSSTSNLRGLPDPRLSNPFGSLGTGRFSGPSQLPALPSPTSNLQRIYTPPPTASTDWTPLGSQPSTLRTPGFRDTRWPF